MRSRSDAVYKAERMGDRGEPCGVPLYMWQGSDRVGPILSVTVHPVRNEWVHRHTLSGKPFWQKTWVA